VAVVVRHPLFNRQKITGGVRFGKPGNNAGGVFKGVLVLPVGEIGNVIFANFSCRAEAERRPVRQIFAVV
jgi:hypothetical protein